MSALLDPYGKIEFEDVQITKSSIRKMLRDHCKDLYELSKGNIGKFSNYEFKRLLTQNYHTFNEICKESLLSKSNKIFSLERDQFRTLNRLEICYYLLNKHKQLGPPILMNKLKLRYQGAVGLLQKMVSLDKQLIFFIEIAYAIRKILLKGQTCGRKNANGKEKERLCHKTKLFTRILSLASYAT